VYTCPLLHYAYAESLVFNMRSRSDMRARQRKEITKHLLLLTYEICYHLLPYPPPSVHFTTVAPRRVHVTTDHIFWARYPACNAHAPYYIICGQSDFRLPPRSR